MISLNNGFIHMRSIKYILTLLILFLSWISLTVIHLIIFDSSATILSYAHNRENINGYTDGGIYAGEKVSGQFLGKENNLGIVSIRFKTTTRIEYKLEDTLIFRIKEKGSKSWYYEGRYKSGLIYDVPLLPFGFPVISNSKDNIYSFEIESIYGNKVNAVNISSREPILISRYQQDKHVLLGSRQELFKFAYKKFFNSFQTVDVWFSSVIYVLPFMFYLIWIAAFSNYAKSLVEKSSRRYINQKSLGVIFQTVIMFIVFFDIIFLQLTSDLMYPVVIILWVHIQRINKNKDMRTFIICLILLISAGILLSVEYKGIAEKSAIWAFMFLAAGLIQRLRETNNISLVSLSSNDNITNKS